MSSSQTCCCKAVCEVLGFRSGTLDVFVPLGYGNKTLDNCSTFRECVVGSSSNEVLDIWPLHDENNRRSRSVGHQWASGAATHPRRMATCSGTSQCEDWLIVTDTSLTLLSFQTPATIDQDTWCNGSQYLRPQLYISWVWTFSLEIQIDRIDCSLAGHYQTP